jgi:NADH dehydrogenase FAD-containing subunit
VTLIRTYLECRLTQPYSNSVIATGSSFKNDMPFKNLSSTDDTKRTLHEWAQRISEAKSIVVAGGGLTGVELAGELGQEYALTGKKEITLICDKDLPLEPRLRRDVRETAKNELERLKVKVITNARASSSPSSNIITLTPTKSSPSTSEKAAAKIPRTLSADLFIPAFGTTPNTSFLPASMLDDRGHVKTTPTLRAEGHDNIFVVGDAGNLQVTQGVYADAQAVYLAKLLDARALGNGREAQLPPYKPDDKIMVGVSLGKNGGVGQMGGWKLWGWMIAMFKSKKLGTQYFPAFVRGDRTILVKKNW